MSRAYFFYYLCYYIPTHGAHIYSLLCILYIYTYKMQHIKISRYDRKQLKTMYNNHIKSFNNRCYRNKLNCLSMFRNYKKKMCNTPSHAKNCVSSTPAYGGRSYVTCSLRRKLRFFFFFGVHPLRMTTISSSTLKDNMKNPCAKEA